KNPPHQRGFLPKFLKDHNIDVVITGNIGKMAVSNLETLGIECYIGIHGNMVDVLQSYLDGTLVSSQEVCTEHQHHHDHGHEHGHQH
ncbi:MAG TPA: NifB/NifX family molybdenum-iron cluster-binding protein, partial [Bacillota bacterium]|nr:NifB/NifX family molybdenum-iron cluster-binding protein [Bacillota bacterium]